MNDFLNKTVRVLVDGVSKYDDNILAGYTEHNKLINFKGDQKIHRKKLSMSK